MLITPPPPLVMMKEAYVPSVFPQLQLAEDPTSTSSPYYPRFQFVNRDWGWGDARNSTIRLPKEQEDGGFRGGDLEGGRRLRRNGGLGGWV